MPTKKRRPSKGSLKPNQSYLKDWDDYQAARRQPEKLNQTPILLPVTIGMGPNGELTRELMDYRDVEKLAENLREELPHYMFERKLTAHDPEKIFGDFIKYFKAQGGSQGPRPPTPLDLMVSMPVWMLYSLNPKAWNFSKDKQYSTINDRDDMCRNFEKIATMRKGKILLLSNRRRCAPKDLKFNLHITISQKIDGKLMKTPIIIDPDGNNNGSGGGFGGWGND